MVCRFAPSVSLGLYLVSMKPEPGLLVRAFWPIADGLRALGFDPLAILRRSGVSQIDLENPDARIPHSAAIGFWDQAVQVTGDHDLGLHLAESARDQSFDLHIYLMDASAKLGDAYQLMCRYQRLIHEATRLELQVQEKRATLQHVLPGGRPAPRQPAEFLLAVWLRAGRNLTGLEWSPEEVHFAHPEPASTSEHQRIFRAPLRFRSSGNRLVFDRALLDRPCLRADSEMLAVLCRLADEVLERLPATDTWADRARNAAAEELRAGDPSIERIASRLHMSARTLQRRLADEGTSYTELQDRLRHELAANYLADARLSIGEVTFLLGYSDLASFHRAVKRWTGMTPAAWSSRIKAGK